MCETRRKNVARGRNAMSIGKGRKKESEIEKKGIENNGRRVRRCNLRCRRAAENVEFRGAGRSRHRDAPPRAGAISNNNYTSSGKVSL